MSHNPFPEILDPLTDEQPENAAPAAKRKALCMIAVITVILLGIIGIVYCLFPPFFPGNITEVPLPELVKTGELLDSLGWIPSSNTYTGLPILIQTPDAEDITLEFFTDHGSFWHLEGSDEILPFEFGTELGDHCCVSSGHAVYWKNVRWLEDGSYTIMGSCPTNYIRVLLKAEGHIVGYAALATCWPFYNDNSYELVTLQYLYYPKVDGKYQQIPESYVNAEMDRIIAQAEEAYLARQATKPKSGALRLPAYTVHDGEKYDSAAADGPGIPMVQEIDRHEGLTLEYITKYGSFFHDPDDPNATQAAALEYFGQTCTVDQNHNIYWRPYHLTADGVKIPVEDKGSYNIYIIFRKEEYIIGCGILYITNNRSDGVYIPHSWIMSQYFHLIDGKHQDVSKEYVLGWIDAHT